MRRIAYLCVVLLIAGCGKEPTFEDAEQLYKKKDYAGAAAAYTPYAEKGDYRAQVYLGHHYLQKENLDLPKAAAYFKKAADQGDIDALYFLGRAYIAGNGVPQNADIGEQYLIKSANAGSSIAMMSLGSLYSDKAQQTWQARDFTKALRYYEQAFEYGDYSGAVFASGIYNMGPLHDKVMSSAWSSVFQMTAERPPESDPYRFLSTKEDKERATMLAYLLYAKFGKLKPPVTYLDSLFSK